jgi:hypothetical protein
LFLLNREGDVRFVALKLDGKKAAPKDTPEKPQIEQ